MRDSLINSFDLGGLHFMQSVFVMEDGVRSQNQANEKS